MAATWPATLPAVPQLRGYEEQSPSNLIRTEMDVGPARTRRRTTSAVRPHAWLFHMTQDQVEIFDQFLGAVLADGALPFEMTHPRTGVTAQFRIKPPAVYTVEKPAVGAEEGVWFVALDVEQLPA